MTLTENRYLLRVWSELGRDEEPCWQATLRDVKDGKVATFCDLQELVKYLTSDPGSNEAASDSTAESRTLEGD